MFSKDIERTKIMADKKLYIKNMVCNRCIMVVRSELEKLGIEPLSVELGEVTLSENLTPQQKEQLGGTLESLGFSLIDDKKARLIEQVKNLIIELVHYNNNNLKINLSDYISEKLHHDYNYISNLFSEVEGTTIEKYFIAQKIEKVKELLVYDELTLNEIAFNLNYSSVAHLSAQFKKVTGLTPSHFKQIKSNKRKPLDEV
ncbi:AraC-like DNA-binding protein [Dysgonomonas sp. PFB1-18]|nr:AraC-like DNA-binding protein [Dysgonomonas sp. PF1-14]MDH6339837.1 AraC-like DNA-binding protein [Dysgonomonas sp. PF1-16]MDH6381485.1 AraC-like DNA-binding protein [Dysgonomonas sp. PFB1-18]MDH6398700.1 AraC-like DNA-binding protein [Dysgonomonas sp. PF1-23]